MSELKQTDLSKRLRAEANSPHPSCVNKADLRAAAEEIERYYTGMLNWKATAETQNTHPSPDAETYLRERYGAYRGHPEWRALEEAFNAGRRSQPKATKPAPIPGLPFADLATPIKEFEARKAAALTSPTDALVAGDRVDAERTGTLYQAVQRAAGELPEGWTICLEIERDAGTVELIDPEGNRKLIDGNDGYLCQAVNEATNAAIQAQKDGHG